MIRVAAFTGGRDVPSARFRVRQYIPSLLDQGIELSEMPTRFGKYPPSSRSMRPLWACGALLENIPSVIRSYSYSAVLLQREMLSTRVTLEPFLKRPRILDVDDAIFLLGDGRFVKRLCAIVDQVICGNAFLAEHFRDWNSRVEVLPTAVDTERYHPRESFRRTDDECVIGWIGTSGNLHFLQSVEPALRAIMQRHPTVKVRVICDRPPGFKTLSAGRCEFVPWSPTSEVAAIQGMDIGLMPLEDSLWARGKCSFKMLQYMACGVPSVVSPVGMNSEVLAMAEVGFPACNESDWVSALGQLVEDRPLREAMGSAGRRVVEQHFSVEVLAPRFASVMRSVIGHV